jgi:hypothetical protein
MGRGGLFGLNRLDYVVRSMMIIFRGKWVSVKGIERVGSGDGYIEICNLPRWG